jgi:hypothetical protein
VTRRPKTSRQRPRPRLCVEELEARCLLDAGFRPIDELGNNAAHPTLGVANTDLLRISPAAYLGDGLHTPSLTIGPPTNINTPRLVSNYVANQADPLFGPPSSDRNTVDQNGLGDFGYTFGQFIDHDLDLTPTQAQLPAQNPDPKDGPNGFPIPRDVTHPTDPLTPNGATIPFTRSVFDPNTGAIFGTPISVGLSGLFNRTGIVNDGSTFTGGLDGNGFALSANLLGPSVTLGDATYTFGAAGVNDIVSAASQTISLQTRNPNQLIINASALTFLATGVNGNQPNQSFLVTYTDNSTQSFTQSLSDWTTPQGFAGESIAVTMPYRDNAGGGMDNTTVYVYQYSFAVNPLKQLQSLTLPSNSNVEVLAVDLTPAPLPVGLAGSFNRTGIVNDGSSFTGGGLDGNGRALSANLLGPSVTFNGTPYGLGAAGVNDVVSAAGQTLSLPAGYDGSLSFLATAVNGNRPNQTFTVTYTDGTTQSFTQSLSDWTTPQGFAGESIAVTMPYRDTAVGGRDNRSVYVYQYSLALNPLKQVQSLTLPNNPNVEVLAIDLTLTNPRQQINANTSYLDLSQVYGSTVFVADALRAHVSGLLKTTSLNLLPYNSLVYFTQAQLNALHMANDSHAVSNDKLFAAGDVRANETVELTALQTLFVRNHNRIADELAGMNPADFGFSTWTDEELYQEARKLNIAEYQNIVYTAFLPALLGPNALPAYTGYNSNVDPSISTEFSTVAFRLGHSLLNNIVPRDNNDGTPIDNPPLLLAQDFFDPNLIDPRGVIDPLTGLVSTDIGRLLKGDADKRAQALDVQAVSSIRNLLFANGQGGPPGDDLISRDLWRADDHGIGTYSQVRVAFGLPPIVVPPNDPQLGFELITTDPTVQDNLFTAYAVVDHGPMFQAAGENVNDINPFIAGLAEDHVPGSDLGPTFQAILVDQFQRLRDGDRFFYLNESFNADEQTILAQGGTLGQIITANTDVTNLQNDVFRVLSQEKGHSSSYYTTTSGQTDLTGSPTGTTLLPSLYNGLVAALDPNNTGRLALVDANGNYLSDTFLRLYSNVQSYLQAQSTNTAYNLSKALLTAEFNVLLLPHRVDPNTSIYVPALNLSSDQQNALSANGVTNPSGIAKVQDVLNASIAELLAAPNPSPGSPDDTYELALFNCLDGMNNNQQIFILV